MNNVELINALHKLPVPSSVGICGAIEIIFRLNHLQAI